MSFRVIAGLILGILVLAQLGTILASAAALIGQIVVFGGAFVLLILIFKPDPDPPP